MAPSDERSDESVGFLGRLKARLNRGGASIARDLRLLLRGRKIQVHVVGDAREPRSYGNAIHEAAYLARQI